MTDREKTIEKIRKLLEHSVENGATEAEAVAFALKAQKLIAENDVEEWELGEKSEEVIKHICDQATHRSWAQWLALAIADNFRCISLRHHKHIPGRKRREIHMVFIGYANDARAAAMVFEHLYQVGDRLARECRRKWEDPYAYDNFAWGFVEGVRAELERQTQALMLVMPKAVQDYRDAMKGVGKARPSRGFIALDRIQEKGRDAGRDAVRAGRIEANESHALASA